jgi:hypothetical protein
MTLDDIVRAKGRFLYMGDRGRVLDALRNAGWEGVSINPPGSWGNSPLPDEEYYGGIRYVEAVLSVESHFLRLLEGYWVRAVTIREVFDQWGSPQFDLICITDQMNGRALWNTEQIQLHLPKWYVLPDDGNNAEVVEHAHKRGYSSKRIDGQLLVLRR